MKLDTKERIGLLSAMPEKTGFADRIVVRAIREEVSIDEQEKDEIGLEDRGLGQLVWSNDKKIDFKLSKDRDRLIRKGFVELVENNKFIPETLTENLFDNLSWTQEELRSLSKVVDEMDKNEQITEFNFDIVKKIKDKAPEEKEEAKEE